jgi:hypothetical protein
VAKVTDFGLAVQNKSLGDNGVGNGLGDNGGRGLLWSTFHFNLRPFLIPQNTL